MKADKMIPKNGKNVENEELVKREQLLNNTIIESVPGVFYVLDEKGKFVRWNAYERDIIIGKSDMVIAKMSGLETIHPDDRALVQSKIENVLVNGREDSIESRVLIHGGPEFRWFLLTGRQMIIDSKSYLVGVGIDITDKRMAEELLRKAQSEITKSLDNLLEGCQIIGYDWKFIYLNNSAAGQGRKKKEEFIGHRIMDVFPGVENTQMFAALKLCMEKREPQHLENEFIYEDGSRGWFELSIQPVDSGIFMLSIDITKRKKVEADLTKQVKDMEVMNKSMVGRELMMVGLKKEIEELKNKLIAK